ncbi:hypothetical protein F4678DRAFT_449296 [Xylaria arbuscula]|nr:hypothetical protein F4678DRAFT_449296 [Xylaria arbuscula]
MILISSHIPLVVSWLSLLDTLLSQFQRHLSFIPVGCRQDAQRPSIVMYFVAERAFILQFNLNIEDRSSILSARHCQCASHNHILAHVG